MLSLIFSIGIQSALEEVSRSLQDTEFLDDVCVLCDLEQVRPLFDLLSGALMLHAGILLEDACVESERHRSSRCRDSG